MLSDEQISDASRDAQVAYCLGKSPSYEHALARAVLAAAIPPGHVVVPVEPTEAMLDAAHDADREYTLRNFGDIMTVKQGPYDHWIAMVEAAQKESANG